MPPSHNTENEIAAIARHDETMVYAMQLLVDGLRLCHRIEKTTHKGGLGTAQPNLH
jgi:hypothetical protein